MDNSKWKHVHSQAGTGAVYGLGLIGVLVYYMQTATTLYEVILGVLKSIIWPALIMYRVFESLKM